MLDEYLQAKILNVAGIVTSMWCKIEFMDKNIN